MGCPKHLSLTHPIDWATGAAWQNHSTSIFETRIFGFVVLLKIILCVLLCFQALGMGRRRCLVCQDLINKLFPFLHSQECCLMLSCLVPECGHLTIQPPAAASSGCCFFGFGCLFSPFPCGHIADERAWLGQFLL